MRYFTPTLILLCISLVLQAQLPENFSTRFKFKRVEGMMMNRFGFRDTVQAIDEYNDKGLIILHRQLGDNSKFRSTKFEYKYDANGRAQSKISITADDIIHEISLYYYGEDGGLEDEVITRELRISMINNHIDTFRYNKDNLMLSKSTAMGKTVFSYNERNDLKEIKYYGDGIFAKDTVIQVILTYNEKGLLCERSVGEYKETYLYDSDGRLISGTEFVDKIVVGTYRFYYD